MSVIAHATSGTTQKLLSICHESTVPANEPISSGMWSNELFVAVNVLRDVRSPMVAGRLEIQLWDTSSSSK